MTLRPKLCQHGIRHFRANSLIMEESAAYRNSTYMDPVGKRMILLIDEILHHFSTAGRPFQTPNLGIGFPEQVQKARARMTQILHQPCV